MHYARAHFSDFVRDLADLVAIPSVSADPARRGDVLRGAERLAMLLRRAGLRTVELAATASNPAVYAQSEIVSDRPTVLVYGHYDVQPAAAKDGWTTPPFQPVVRGADLRGRGASDDKGQVMIHVKTVESLLASGEPLSVNLKCLFEGAEEIGSPGLRELIIRNRNALAADVAMISDTRILGPRQPALTYSLRGSLNCELQISTLTHDLHSGGFGGAVRNSLEVTARILTGLHREDGSVAIAGFYDDVHEEPLDERRFMAAHGPSDAAFLKDAAVARSWGEPGYTLYERATIRPSLSVTGITGGYQGPGGKAVIPANAGAKLNFRLVPDQHPTRIQELFRKHLRKVVPPGVRADVSFSAGVRPAVIDRDLPVMKAAAQAYRVGFGRRPVYLRSGGTIPVVNDFAEVLNLPVVLMGFALPDDRMHAPNEKFHLPQLIRGIETVLAFYAEVSNLTSYRKRATVGRREFN